MVICHLDCDLTGSASVSHLVQSGHVISYPVPDFTTAEQIVKALSEGRIPCDMVVLDTATALADAAMMHILVDPSKAKGGWEPWWDKRKALKGSWDDYGTAGRVWGNLLFGLRRLPIPNIIVAHEAEKDDPLGGAKAVAPNLQKKINDALYAHADGILRLFQASTAFQWNGAMVPPNTRILQLARTADAACGVRVPPTRQVPPILIEPTFQQFVEVIGYVPHSLVIYGPPKVGKTTFVASAAYLTPGATYA